VGLKDKISRENLIKTKRILYNELASFPLKHYKKCQLLDFRFNSLYYINDAVRFIQENLP